MKMKLMGLLAGLALASPALAQDDSSYGQREEQSEGENKLKGTVLGSRGDELLIQTEDGAAVPLKVSKRTQVDGKPIEGSVSRHLKQEFSEGDEVRTSFNLKEKKMENEAVSIDKEVKTQ